MDFPIPVEYFPYLIGAVFAVIVVVLIWQLRLKEVYQLPLANEEDLGIGKIWLEKLGQFNEGRITTAHNYFASLFGQVLAGQIPDNDRQSALDLRKKIMEKRYPLAQRNGREKIIYLFDANPLDPKYSHREDRGDKTPVRSIGPVLDCGSREEYDGFKWIWVKLDKTTVPYSSLDLPVIQNEVDGMKFLRYAAANISENKALRERNEALTTVNLNLNERLGKVTSENDEFRTALGIHSLQDKEMPKVGFGWQKAKQWIGDWKQWGLGLLGYFVIAPWAVQNFMSNAPPASTGYLNIGIAAALFFALPLARRLFGRWLK